MYGGHQWNPLQWAAHSGQAEAVNMLCRHGANVNLEDSWAKRTPLSLAAASGHCNCVGELILHGALVKMKRADVSSNVEHQEYKSSRRQSRTALAVATEGGHAACVRLL